MATNVIEMSVQDWISVADNPRQRNTQKRATVALSKHLAQYEPIHRFVWAATKNGTILCKLDGHTRALLWEQGLLATPPEGSVCCILIPVNGPAEAKKFYDMLDSSGVCKKPADKIFGALRENGMALSSALLRACTFTTQLQLANSGKSFTGEPYQLVRNWKDELKELDSWSMTSNFTLLIGVMLMAIRRTNKEKAKEFFTKLDNNEGTKTSAGSDGIQALWQHMETRRAEDTTAGWDNLMDICRRSWYAYHDCYLNNRLLIGRSGLRVSKHFDDIFSHKVTQ